MSIQLSEIHVKEEKSFIGFVHLSRYSTHVHTVIPVQHLSKSLSSAFPHFSDS
jgi:hypothetical protein